MEFVARGWATVKDLRRLSLRASVLLPIFAIVLMATPLGYMFPFVMLVLPVLLACWTVAGIGVLAGFLDVAARRKWREACGLLAVMAVVAVGVAEPLRLSRSCYYLANALNLAVMMPVYKSRIAQLPEADQRQVVFNRGGMIWASAGIVFDPTDQALLPANRRSADWLERAEQNELSCEPQARPLWGHFFYATFSC